MLNNSLFSSDNQKWATPLLWYQALNKHIPFTCDPCAEPETAKCAKFYTKEDDGLVQDWSGEILFVNPEYNREQIKWVKKAHESTRGNSDTVVVMLIPARTDTAIWHDLIFPNAEVVFLRGRLTFGTADYWQSLWDDSTLPQGKTNSAPFPSAVVKFGHIEGLPELSDIDFTLFPRSPFLKGENLKLLTSIS